MSDNALIRALRSFGQGASNAVASNVSAPVDGLAWLLRKGGLPIPQNPVGGSDWMAQQGLTATPQNRIAGLLGETAGMVGPAVVQAAAPKIAGGLLALDDKAMDMARQGIERRMVSGGMIQPATVWHGSPHKFDKFDSSKIGTGEGAQAYGHGLYLAENPAVAKEYQKNLSREYLIDGKPYAGNDPDIKQVLDAIALGGQRAEDWIRLSPAEAKLPQLVKAAEFAKTLIGKKVQPGGTAGALYKVDLPDNAIARMLDWDKPLSQQAPEVQKTLADYASLGGVQLQSGMTGKQVYDAFGAKVAKAKGYTPSEYGKVAKSAAEDLRWAGIPGIRYLDGGSRGAGQGSSNYVIFPGQEDILKILERNGVPIK